MSTVIEEIETITQKIIERSKPTRETYLSRLEEAALNGVKRASLDCGNIAHACAASSVDEKDKLSKNVSANIGIITSYNDMLSAHKPFENFPAIIKQEALAHGATAQVSSGVPAMCDGVTQGQDGMELSLFSRDVIAMSAAVGLSHNMYDAAVYLGVCDKIIPGLTIAALTFGHIPAVFIPAGPMTSGISNEEKVLVRQEYAKGNIGRDELLQSEMKSYHGPGTCTFYGTANSNQMLMELMGLHIPGSSFINPGTPLRDALTRAATSCALANTQSGNSYKPVGKMIDEKSVVNGIIGLHATGGSTNHTIHLIAMALAAGIKITWQDLSELSDTIPLLTRIYPNGPSDVNHFHAAGGMGVLVRELLDNGLLHEDVNTVWGDDPKFGKGMRAYATEAVLGEDGEVVLREALEKSGDSKIIGTVSKPFRANGGVKVLTGNLGQAVIKVSAVKEKCHIVEAPAKVFNTQKDFLDAFKTGTLEEDFIAVIRFQGPQANGMPELHKLTPPLGVLQDKGFTVGLVTDGRLSGASGKVPAAIHTTPEAASGGRIAYIEDGDMLRIDAVKGKLELHVKEDILEKRKPASHDLSKSEYGTGRELFQNFRKLVSPADQGASIL